LAKRGRKGSKGGGNTGRNAGADATEIGVATGAATTTGATDAAGIKAVDDPLVDFAEDLGRFLGTVQSKATSWLDQRTALAEKLTQIRDTADGYLKQLSGGGVTGSNAPHTVTGARRGRPPGSAAAKRGAGGEKGSAAAPEAVAPRGKKKRTMSPEAREKIAAAQRARWAKQRKGA
jgi:hypothetical protein